MFRIKNQNIIGTFWKKSATFLARFLVTAREFAFCLQASCIELSDWNAFHKYKKLKCSQELSWKLTRQRQHFNEIENFLPELFLTNWWVSRVWPSILCLHMSKNVTMFSMTCCTKMSSKYFEVLFSLFQKLNNVMF